MAAKITKLTPAQLARIPEVRDQWLATGLSTERADRPRAEAGVRLAYEAAGLEPPKIIVWLDSPMAGTIGAALLSGTKAAGAQVRAQVGAQVWAQVRDQVRDQVGAQVWAQVGDQVWDQVGAQVGAQVRGQVWGQVGGQVRDQVGAQVYRAVWGQHDVGWLSFYAYFAEVCGLDAAKRLRGLSEVAAASGWWWPFSGVVILTERPTVLARDMENRLHSDTGPALLYPDGFGIWAIHGLRVDRRIIEAPETLTAAEVRDEPNAETRRHMLDRYAGLRGSAAAGRWLADMGRKPISQVDITAKMQPSGLSIWRMSHGDEPVMCKLYRAEMPDDEPLVLLWVVCTSTAKEVFLRVPPHMKDAAGARDWTFDGAELAEAVET